jgi:hypothetical protein
MKPLQPLTGNLSSLDEEIQLRQLASRKVTVQPRACDCKACVSGPRRPASMIVNGVTKINLGAPQRFFQASWEIIDDPR